MISSSQHNNVNMMKTEDADADDESYGDKEEEGDDRHELLRGM